MMVEILQNRCMGKQFLEKGNNNGLSSREHRYRKLHEQCTVLHDTFAKKYIYVYCKVFFNDKIGK
jgi:hypothetical protein